MIEKVKSILKKDSQNISNLNKKYRLSFDIKKTTVLVFIESKLICNKLTTAVTVENNNNTYYVEQSPEEMVKIFQEFVIGGYSSIESFLKLKLGDFSNAEKKLDSISSEENGREGHKRLIHEDSQ